MNSTINFTIIHLLMPLLLTDMYISLIRVYWSKQAFDTCSIAGNTVVPYRSLKKFFNYHKLLFIAIYNEFNFQIQKKL